MDLYIVLGVAHEATGEQIRRAYRRLARRYHPDIYPGDDVAAARFRQIAEAYETLIDPARRSRYDAGQDSPEQTARHEGSFEGFDFSTRGVDHSATFGDLVAEVLSERGRRLPPAQRGADLHLSLEVSFAQALRGGARRLAVTRRGPCRACGGQGRTRPVEGACRACDGAGSERSVRGHMVFSRPCGVCGGTGRGRPQACASCGGGGKETRSETMTVRVPAGVTDGARLLLAGKGDVGAGGGPAGDVYVTVKVGEHAGFRRVGDDIHTTLPLAVHEAALGARVVVPTLEGQTELRVPPGTQSGQCFRVRGLGAPSARGADRGDLVVEARIMLPALLDERSKELLREFGRINDRPVRGEGHGEAI